MAPITAGGVAGGNPYYGEASLKISNSELVTAMSATITLARTDAAMVIESQPPTPNFTAANSTTPGFIQYAFNLNPARRSGKDQKPG